MASLKYWIWLSECKGLTMRSKHLLLEHFGSPEEIWCAEEESLRVIPELDPQQVPLLADKSFARADEILAACREKEIRIITLHDAEYPVRLRNIFEPPCLLYVRGRMPCFDEEAAIAMVGTRRATPYGIKTAEELGYALSRQGALVVSGGAHGIDTASLRGALRAGGKAAAVLGCGVDVVYPAGNGQLFADIAAVGALISEYPPGTLPESWHFPVRNRIMSGLCVGTLVVEAPEGRSGALITANDAIEQGRDLFAVPGPIDAPMSRGCNRLIAENAFIALDAQTILREYVAMFPDKLAPAAVELPERMGEESARPQAEKEKEELPVLDLRRGTAGLTDDQITLVKLLRDGPMQADDLIDLSELPTRRVLSALTVLQIDGYIEENSGKIFSLRVKIVD